MLNVIWPIFIIVSIIYGFFSGNIDKINATIFESTKGAVDLSINMLGTMCLWNGFIAIANKTKLIGNLLKLLKPIIRKLFPDQKNNKKIQKEISMNMIANILGLGNAATPLGIKAMQSMQQENNNKETINDSMAMFIVLNTASIQLIPTTVLAIRSSLESKNPSSIIVPVWMATILAALAGILATKFFIRISKKEK